MYRRASGARTRRLPPRLRTATDALERHASALELFFDMVFVVAVTQLADTLLQHPTALGVGRFLVLFVAIAWCWVGFTFYADRFDNDDVVYRVTMLAAMLAVSLMAASLPEAFTDEVGSTRFVLSYVGVRLMLVALYARAHVHVPDARRLTGRYLAWFVAGASIWGASVFVPNPWRFVMWGLGMTVELLTPLMSGKAVAAVPFHVSHIPERFGLFVIIVLGEEVALNAYGITTARYGATAALVAAGGFLLVAAQWWLYFDCVDTAPMTRWRYSGMAYVYGHLVVFAALAASGVGTLLAVQSALGEPFDPSRRMILSGGVAAFLVAIGVVHLVHTWPGGDRRGWARVAAGVVIAGVPLAGAAATPLQVEAFSAVVLCVLVAFELRTIAAAADPGRPAL